MESFLDLLRDPVWQGLSAWVAIILFFYFLHDRHITKERTAKLRTFFIRAFWITIICYTFSGLISLSIGLKDGFSDGVIVAWLGTGAFFTIIALVVDYQDEKKKGKS